MKHVLSKIVSSIVAALLVVFVSIPSHASDKKTIVLHDNSQLSDSQLTPGNYKIEVRTTGETGELYFYKGKNVVAKAPIELEKLNTKVEHSSLSYQPGKGKSRRIVEVRIAGEQQSYKILDRGDSQASKKGTSSGGN